MSATHQYKAARRLAIDTGWAFLAACGASKPGSTTAKTPRPADVGVLHWQALGASAAVRSLRSRLWLAWRTYRFIAWDAPLHPGKPCCATGHHVNPWEHAEGTASH